MREKGWSSETNFSKQSDSWGSEADSDGDYKSFMF